MADRAEEVERAERELDRTLDRIGRTGVKGGNGVEAAYGQAYQRLVLLGARPQIRGKYRGLTG